MVLNYILVGAPEKFLGNICSFKQLFYSKKSLGALERESELRSCEEREREKPRVSHSPCRFTALSLFREENFKKNLWDYSLKFIRLLRVVFPSQQLSDEIQATGTRVRYVSHSHEWPISEFSGWIPIRSGPIWATARKGHGSFLRVPSTEIFRTKWYLMTMIYFKRSWGRALPGIKRCWVSLPPPPSPLGLDTFDSPFPRWGARIWKGNDC